MAINAQGMIRDSLFQNNSCAECISSPHLSEQEERCEIGVHDVSEFFRRVVHRGLADAGPHVVDQDIKQTTEMLSHLKGDVQR